MYQDTTNYEEALKLFWSDVLTEYSKFHTWMYDGDDIKVDTKFFNGRSYVFPVDIRTGVSVGSRPEGGALPEFYKHTPVEGTVTPQRHYVTLAITGPLQAQGEGSQQGIWEGVNEKLMRKATQTFGEQMSRAMWTTRYGILCEVASVAAVAGTQYTVTIKNKNTVGTTFSNPTGTAPETVKYLMKMVGRKLIYGQTTGGIQFAATDPTGRGECTVVSVAWQTSPFTAFVIDIAANPGTPPLANDVFVLGDAVTYGRHDYAQEVNGWLDVCAPASAGTFMDISPTTYPEWTGTIMSANPATSGVPATPTEDRMQALYDQITNVANVERISALACTPSTYRTLVTVLRNKGGERFMPCEFKGGLRRLAWNFSGDETPIVKDFYAPGNEIAYITREKLAKCETRAFSFDDSNGGVWKWQPGVDAYVAYAKQYFNVGVFARNAQGRLTDVATATTLS